MRVTKLFGKTLHEDPAGAELPSHRLMLRAGLISQVVSGVYSYLPLALRSLRKVEQIIREEMDAAGGQELRMPVIHPRDLWDRTGRADTFPGLITFKDRREREMVVAPSHEEVVTPLVASNVSSYRDLPVTLYQIQTKFRDEPRPRGGLIRVREFDMKDAYSFDIDEEGLDLSYGAMREAYKNIYERCGLSSTMVEADSGAMGGKDSQEFMALTDSGEDTIVFCESCGYAANTEAARFTKPPQPEEPPGALEEVHTPGVKTIEELADLLDIPTRKTLKAVFYMADGEMVFATIRGDLEVNETKLANALGATTLRLARPEEVEQAGLVAGSASPVGLAGVRRIADDSIELGSNFVVGANKEDYHLRNANHPRDFDVDLMTDIALAQEGHPCPNCQATLALRRGIEVGHIFKLGTRYSEALGANFSDADDRQQPVIMGCYGIGVGRLLAAVIEQNHDDKGIIFPRSIAPYDVWLAALNVEKEDVAREAEALYESLQQKGVQVLYDDRKESAGVKLNDADLLGLPVRLVVSPRNLRQDAVEVKVRSEPDASIVPREQAVERVEELLGALG
jgi:prolyl-tRNA synthetase